MKLEEMVSMRRLAKDTDLPIEFLLELGIAWVTLFKKIRPFNRRRVSFLLFGEVMGGGAGVCAPFCFLRMELFLPPRLAL